MTNVAEISPLIKSRRELENTIKAMHAGSIQIKVATA